MDSKNQKSDIMEMLQTINNNKGVVQTKNILKALNKMGMDWIKRTIHQSTIWQRIKTILVTMFILSAFSICTKGCGRKSEIRPNYHL